ncbi:ribonuclease 3 [bacterium BMS3Abin07]|nr:ribonuclease 3 [bacterium BMS3Abin07]GBE32015.1 ribonuclease 3 [bacterium BMS3Bbin05]HDO22033.1 ribonuclease III [Nitrospirota bacterium]
MPVFYSGSTVEIEKELGYRFKDRHILNDALTHKSFYHENQDNSTYYNERLEFLGDTVLGLVVSEFLYRKSPILSESEMSRIKSYLVSGRVLSMIANNMNLGIYLNLGKGEIETGGRTKRSILADSLEALFGAVFIDGGYTKSREVILKLFGNVIHDAIQGKKYLDHKTELQEISQRMFGVLPDYSVVQEDGLEHKKVFSVNVSVKGKVFGSGRGGSKKKAETEAAKDALEKISENR